MNFVKKTYEKNIRLIKNTIPKVYKKLMNTDETNYRISISQSGHKNISKFFNEKYIFIHSNENPVYQAKFVADEILKEDKDIIFIFGLGLGYEINEFLRRDDKRIYFIVEPDIGIFKETIRYVDLNTLVSKNVTMVISNNVKEIMESFRYLINEKRTLSCRFFILPSYSTIYKGFLNELNENLGKFFKDIKTDVYTTYANQRIWLYNYICNLEFLNKAISIRTLENLLEDMPVVIVGAGPSLNYNFDTLKNIYNKALIIAVGTAVKILVRNNIKFHVVAAVDAHKKAFDFNEIGEIKDHILFYSNQVDPSILKKMGGTKFIFNQSPMDSFILENLNYSYYERFSGPSISNIVVNSIADLGCKKIFLLGQDMCYVDNNLYAKGAEKDNNFSEEQLYISSLNKNGDKVFTNTQYLAIKHSMERCIIAHPNSKFYNGTRDGLNIEGADNIDFNLYWLENLNKEYNILNKINDIYIKYIKKIDEGQVHDFIINIKNSNEEIIKICRNIITSIETHNSIEEVKDKYNELYKIEFFKYIFKDAIKYCDFIYSDKSTIEKNKQTYAYILEKCLLIRTAFEDELSIK